MDTLNRLLQAIGIRRAPAPRRPTLLAVAPGHELAAAAGRPSAPSPPADGSIAVVPLLGFLSKYPGDLAPGRPTLLDFAAQVRAAAVDDRVSAILVYCDSPGGTVAGTVEAAQALAFAAGQKPTHAHLSDDCSSAAYWICSQASRLTTNQTGHIGSLGVFTLLVDDSDVFARAGFKVRVVSSGGAKGGGPGAPISDEQIAAIQQNVDDVTAIFVADVARGRGMSVDQVKQLADGRVHVGQRAVDMRLVDGVSSFGAAVAVLRGAAGATGFVEPPTAELEAPDEAETAGVSPEVARLIRAAGAPAKVAAVMAGFDKRWFAPEQRELIAGILLDAALDSRPHAYDLARRFAANVCGRGELTTRPKA